MYQSLNPKEIPKFEVEINNQELKSCLKEITFQLKTQDKYIQKLRKQMELRPTTNEVGESLKLAKQMIQIDPNLLKMIRNLNKKNQNENILTESSVQLGKKVNTISQCLTYLNNRIKTFEKQVSDQDNNTKSLISSKTDALQKQIYEITTKTNKNYEQLNEKVELSSCQFGDKVRELQTKTLWQINQCKMKLSSCINEQMIKDAMKQLEGKTQTMIKRELLRQGSIDPEQIEKIELSLSRNEKQFLSCTTEINCKIDNLKDHLENSVMSKKNFSNQKLEIQKRFSLIGNNFTDVYRIAKSSENDIYDLKEKTTAFDTLQKQQQKQISRVKDIVKNLQIGEDFQNMLDKIDPHKICALDEIVGDLQLKTDKFDKNIEIARKQIDRLRSKTQFCSVMTGNSDTSKLTRQDVSEIVNQFFVSNQLTKKMQHLQSQMLEVRSFPDMVNEINKKIGRFQKQTDTQSLVHQLRTLQQYIKKEILIVNNRINGIELKTTEQRKRPTSGHRSGSEAKISTSISYKKLTPVNCISCYQNTVTPERKTVYKKFY